MKINHSNVGGPGASGAGRAELDKISQTNTSSRAAAAGSAGSSDRIELSNLSYQLRSLSGDSPERANHLERLAEAVASGNYQVNAEAVSKGLIEEAEQGPIE